MIACGNCGTETDTCGNSFQWQPGQCQNQGACAVGATRTIACGNCGSQTDTCSNSCQWTAGSCTGQGTCAPGATQTVACGNGGMETDTCSNQCQWVAGTCNGQGACTPGQTRNVACGNCGAETDTCGNNFQWQAGSCQNQGACAVGATRTIACGNCGSETDTCSNSCQWTAGSCAGQGARSPGQTQPCGCGTSSCQNNCQWATCTPPTETCNGLDDDCNGIVDDPLTCWKTIYRFVDANGARCWGPTVAAPVGCNGYNYGIEAFVVHSNQVPNTFEGRQCSKGTDHIIVPFASTDYNALVAAAYDCSLSLGYFYNFGTGPTSGRTPFANTCPLYRFSYNTGGGGAHLFTRGADNLAGTTCEPPARAEVFTNFSCFGGKPGGC